jgi:formate--tetrahydrofolate ligase
MAILCLALDYKDLRKRLERILIGFTHDDQPITPKDLKAVDAMMILLKYAMLPNLVQSIEGVPAFVHGGPFANIAHGTSSAITARLALSKADYVVTEAGFGFDLGAEKFMDIFSQNARIKPDMVVMVATARALKMHGGVPKNELNQPNPEAVRAGLPNLNKHIENKKAFNLCSVVAINRYLTDTDEEIQIIIDHCNKIGIRCAVAEGYIKGGEGMKELAKAAVETLETCNLQMQPLYKWDEPVVDKIMKIATRIYGAEKIDLLDKAIKDMKIIEKLGYDKLPVCIAKTQNSLSDNPKLLGRPKDFLITVREIQIAAGAGFIVPITGEITRMPGLPKEPNAESFKIDDNGNIINMF